jgi:hypothetical protein
MNAKTASVNIALLLGATTGSFLLCECAARVFLNPADYLMVGMVPDKVVGAVVSSESRTGFDRWGFRNLTVPRQADIVALGDSHTYGNTAKMSESWPKVLESLTGRSVYNMGMGGYGPNQYLYLLRTKGLGLKPRLVLCGLYVGDDFENAYSITYGLDYWAYLRILPAEKANPNIWTTPVVTSWQKSVRVWLSQHSVSYQLLVHASAIGRMQGEAQIKTAAKFNDSATTLILPKVNIMEAFLPKSILSRLDQQDPNVVEGMRITFKILKEMNDLCVQNQAKFMVVVIPTKEMVFAQYLENNPTIALNEILNKLIVNERLALGRTFDFLGESNIQYIDPLPALRNAVGQQLYARTAADMHPSKNGYKVIGKAVFEALRSQQWQ